MNTLTQEQILEMAKYAGFNAWSHYAHGDHIKNIANTAFAKGFALGVAQEREECAKVCELLPNGGYYGYGNDGESYAEAIRARK
jgi:hypothetical protein